MCRTIRPPFPEVGKNGYPEKITCRTGSQHPTRKTDVWGTHLQHISKTAIQLGLEGLVEETFAGQDVQAGALDSYFYGVVAFGGFGGLGDEGYGVFVAGFFG